MKKEKYLITLQANGKFSIYTNESEYMSDETLIKWDINSAIEAEKIVTDKLKGVFSYDV